MERSDHLYVLQNLIVEVAIASASEEAIRDPILSLLRKIGGRGATAADAIALPVTGTGLQMGTGDIARAHTVTGRDRALETGEKDDVTRTEGIAIARGQESAHTTGDAHARPLRRDAEAPMMKTRKARDRYFRTINRVRRYLHRMSLSRVPDRPPRATGRKSRNLTSNLPDCWPRKQIQSPVRQPC